MAFRPDGRRRPQTQRTRVAIAPEEADPDVEIHDVRWREERVQSSTGRVYQSARAMVDEDAWLPAEDAEIGLDPNGDLNDGWLVGEMGDFMEEPEILVENKQRSIASRRPMVHWKEGFRDIYLDELLHWEGRGDGWESGQVVCCDCRARKSNEPAAGEYRCLECFIPALVCQDCCVRRHRMLPLHVVEKWTSTTFIKSSLKALGLRIQLNHMSMQCSNPEPCHTDFVVLHTNGLHQVAVDFCGCTQRVSNFRQLLRRGLFPATQDLPRTCATFALLRQLHLLSLTSKCSTYDYYRALEGLTNNTGINLPKSKYRTLLRLILQWRHLQMLKRGGRGHDEAGAAGTSEGKLALACPSCPRPGVNIPDDWKSVSDEKKFLYFICLCIDANFRLKNQLVSNYSTDPGLGIGMSYMVKHEPYEEYVKSREKDLDNEGSKGCGLQAVEKAHTKFSKGLRYTGVSAVSCGRSEMIMPCSVGNLKKGEKYACMDYVAGMVLRFVAVLFIIFSYDIACQWFVNLRRRIDEHWPDHIKPGADVSLSPLIPKLHDAGHKKTKNHEQFSFNFFKGVGNTDGECPERIWAGNNAVANATKSMGPGSQHDILDDHFGFWNFLKYVGMGKTLMKKYRKAVPERNRQVEAHRGFTSALDADDVVEWEEMCKQWENDIFPKSVENPYHIEGTNLTQDQVRKELADEEQSRLAAGGVAYHETSASMFLVMGLDIEELQRRLVKLVNDKARGVAGEDGASIAEQRTLLRQKIERWRKIQAIYMPGLLQFLKEVEHLKPGTTLDGDKSEGLHLWLPSSLPMNDRERICLPGVPASEEKLRTAQCYDSLASIRNTLRLRTRIVQFKHKNVRGQRGGTRSHEFIERVHNRARRQAAMYRAARMAKLELSGHGQWEETLRELRDSDIRSYQDPERMKPKQRRRGTYEDGVEVVEMEVDDDMGDQINLLPESRRRRDGTGKTHLMLSWIWTVEHQDSPSENTDTILRAEWTRSRARVQRATEEVQLLREEMRRVLLYLDWKARWWSLKQSSHKVEDVILAEGLQSYSIHQASFQRDLHEAFRVIWKGSLEDEITVGETDDLSDEEEGSDEEVDQSEDSDDEL